MSRALFTDLYEINMVYTYWKDGLQDRRAVFEAFFRELPFRHPFTVFAGLQRLAEYLQEFAFLPEDLDYLNSLGYERGFLDYLGGLRFNGDLYALREGELVFPREPMLRLEGELGILQILETAVLNIVNYQSLIATKAARVREAAGDDPLMEFGSRRAQEADAAVWGARAAFIGGFDGTSNLESGQRFGIPVKGTHAHSFVQVYGDELQAFERYLETHDHISLLIDTYDTLRSGVVNAIQAARQAGRPLDSVRIDSGDLVELSQEVRRILNREGFTATRIIGSNDLDEYEILRLKQAGACIDMWGIGTRIITAYDQPALGGVYKLVAIADSASTMQPSMKRSSSAEKATLPGAKAIVRRLEKGKAAGDMIVLADEDPSRAFREETAEPVLVEGSEAGRQPGAFLDGDIALWLPLGMVVQEGRLVRDLPDAEEARNYHRRCRALFCEYGWSRQGCRDSYPVRLSRRVQDLQARCEERLRRR